MPNQQPHAAPEAAPESSSPDDHADAGPPLNFSPRFVRWHVASSMAIAAVALGVVFWPAHWPLAGRGHLHAALMLLMGVSIYLDWRVGLLGLTPYQLYLRFRQPGSLLHRWCGRLHNLASLLFFAAAFTHSCTG